MAHVDLCTAIEQVDFSLARAKLVTSVPGRHKQGENLKFGQMAVRVALSREKFDTFAGAEPASLALQFSSLPLLTRKYFDSMVKSFSAGFVHLANPGIVWPTAKEVMESAEGEAGNFLPGPLQYLP